ncbi:MAG: PaaI family thioesterase [Pseudomonadota bacterium]
MNAKNPDYRKALEHGFASAQFVQANGAELADCGPGWADASIEINSQHLQQNRFIHGGLQATLADHTAGAAATTLIDAKQFVLTMDMHIHFLRAAEGEYLVCRAKVLKPGAQFSVVESELYARKQGVDTLVSKASVTLAVLGHD